MIRYVNSFVVKQNTAKREQIEYFFGPKIDINVSNLSYTCHGEMSQYIKVKQLMDQNTRVPLFYCECYHCIGTWAEILLEQNGK